MDNLTKSDMAMEDVVQLQKILRRMQRMGILPAERDRVILAQEEEILKLREKIKTLEARLVLAPVKPKTHYLCDRRACEKCLPIKNGCRHTPHVEHAKNFELRGDVFVELERVNG